MGYQGWAQQASGQALRLARRDPAYGLTYQKSCQKPMTLAG